MVRPISMGDMPRFSAMAAAPATNRSALQTSMIKPTNIAAEAISIRAIILLQ
jgi:hypothetical protein